MSQAPDRVPIDSSSEPDPRRWAILAVVVVAQLMVVLDASIVTIALPSAQRALHISVANRQWVITAYTLAFGGLLLLGGRIADYGGRRRMFIIGLIGFAGASALGGLAAESGDAVWVTSTSGCICCADGPRRPVHLNHHFSIRPEGAGEGVRSLRGGVGGRRCHRRAGRGNPHGVRLVAVVLAGQRPDRPAGGGGCLADRPREPGRRNDPVRHPGRASSPPQAWSAWSTGSPRRTPTVGHPPPR